MTTEKAATGTLSVQRFTSSEAGAWSNSYLISGASDAILFDVFMVSAAMLMQTVLLWQMASLARTNAVSVRRMIVVIAVATIASGVIGWRFIFPLPALFSSALVIALAAAYVAAR